VHFSIHAGITHRPLQDREGEMEFFIAFGIFATIWLVVLWGSRYFGPKD
jgi:hypothetical protein